MRTWTTTCGLILGLSSANLIGMRSAKAADLKHTIAEIEHHAERVFKLLDKDADGTIAGDELANLAVRVQREMKILRSQYVIGGRVQLQPVAAAQAAVVDRNAIKLPEFTAAFVTTAAQLDAEIRAQRVIHASVAAARQAANDAAIYSSSYHSSGARSKGKDDDDNFREKRMDRDDKLREKRMDRMRMK